ncbi:MAG: hypothetical protein AB7F43_06140 [Bacteriovoracia bacterium]
MKIRQVILIFFCILTFFPVQVSAYDKLFRVFYELASEIQRVTGIKITEGEISRLERLKHLSQVDTQRMTKEELIDEINSLKDLLGSLKREFRKDLKVVVHEGQFYPIPNIGRYVAGITAASAFGEIISAFRYPGHTPKLPTDIGKSQHIGDRFQEAIDPFLVFATASAMAALFHWASYTTETLALVPIEEKEKLAHSIELTEENLELLEKQLELNHEI